MDPITESLVALNEEQERERLERLVRSWRYYQGEPDQPLRTLPGAPNDNVVIDLPREVVDTGVSFLYGDDLTITADESLKDGATDWLADTLRHLHQGGPGLLFQHLGVNCGVGGHGFVKLQSTPDGWRAAVIDPSDVQVFWSAKDVSDVQRYWITKTTIINTPSGPQAGAHRQRIERDESGLSWAITDEESVSSDGQWNITGTPVRWAFPWPPIFDCQNLPQPNEFYGLSDLEPAVLDLCDAINRLASHMAKVVRIHVPRLYSKGMDVKQVQWGIDTLIELPDKESELGYLEGVGDLEAAQGLYDRLMRAFRETTRTPEVATGKLENSGQLTGIALKVMYGPLSDKTATKRRTQGAMIERMCSALLVLGGFATKIEDATCHIQWPELIPSDPMEEAQALQAHEELGIVSKETIAGKLGYDWEQEKQRIQDEQAEGLDQGNTDPRQTVSASLPGDSLVPDEPARAA